MRDPAAGRWRALRAAVAATVMVGLSTSAHTLAGGTAADPALLLVLAALVAPLCWWSTRIRLRPAHLVALLLGGQALVHLALTTMAPAGSGTATRVAGHAHGALVPVLAAPGAGATDPATGAPGLLMLGAHVAATVLTAAVLARGEALLWAVARRLLTSPARPTLRARPVRLGLPAPAVALTPALAGPAGARAPPRRA
ncbi:MAG TPA: hypothetical protein VES95_11950 [Dermatophilaceae bacterium]|nr:hypothetical protein [Dermatophilaceae bacterium]